MVTFRTTPESTNLQNAEYSSWASPARRLSLRSLGIAMMAADIIFESLIGRIEGFADGHGKILPGLPVDRDLRSRDTDDHAHPDASAKGMAAGTVHPHAAFLDPGEEMAQFLGSL